MVGGAKLEGSGMAGGKPDFFASSLVGEDMSGWIIALNLNWCMTSWIETKK